MHAEECLLQVILYQSIHALDCNVNVCSAFDCLCFQSGSTSRFSPEFDGMHAEECLLQAGLEQDQPIYRPRSIEEGTLLQNRMLYFSENSAKSPIHLVGWLYLLLDELIEFSANRQNIENRTSQDFYINEAVVYIQQNYNRELTVDEVANFCKLKVVIGL